jgi:hypothetical protein
VKGSTLAVTIDAQKVGYVHQKISFTAKPSGIGKTIESSLVHRWNFGDGNEGYGKELTHEYLYPGTYIVTLHSAYGTQKQLSRHEITILPVAMTLTQSPLGDIQINNDSPYEIDISGFMVEGKRPFVFPQYSLLLPNQTITLPSYKVGSGVTRIKDTLGSIVTAGFSATNKIVSEINTQTVADSQSAAAPRTFTEIPSPLLSPAPPVAPAQKFGFATGTPLAVPSASTSIASMPVPLYGSTTSTPAAPKDKAWPYIGLIVIITLGLVSTALKASRNQTE